MITLERKGNEVFYKGKKLTIVPQATKGPNKEVVKIEGLEGSNGQKWISLAKLKEGSNDIECVAREVTSTNVGGYAYTEEEAKRVKELEAELAEIKARAKERYVAKPKLLSEADIAKMDDKAKDEYAQKLMAYIQSVKKA